MAKRLPFYQSNLATLYLGDCVQIMSLLPTESIPLIITSPPYYRHKVYEHFEDYKAYLALLSKAFKEIARLLTNDGLFFLNINSNKDYPRNAITALELAEGAGLKFVQEIIWFRKNATHYRSHKRLVDLKEYIWLLSKCDKYMLYPERWMLPTYDTYGSRYGDIKPIGNIWRVTTVKHNQFRNYKHPAMFPEELVERMITIVGNNNLILDPFAGLATTLAAAIKLNKHCIGIEIDKGYCETAKLRLMGAINVR